MARRRSIPKQDIQRAAEIAKEMGCCIEIQIGDTVITIHPETKPVKETGIDYSRPSL